MRWVSCFFSILVGASLLVLATPADAAKKKLDPKAFPVKVIKASETKFKHAKIVQAKPEKKGFLWFKKKKHPVTQSKVVSVGGKPVQPQVLNPESGKTNLLPKPVLPVSVQPPEAGEPSEMPTK